MNFTNTQTTTSGLSSSEASGSSKPNPSETYVLALRPKTNSSSTYNSNKANRTSFAHMFTPIPPIAGEETRCILPPLRSTSKAFSPSHLLSMLEPAPSTGRDEEASMMSASLGSEGWLARGGVGANAAFAPPTPIPQENAWPPALLTPLPPSSPRRRSSLFPSDDDEDNDDKDSTTIHRTTFSANDSAYDADSESSSPSLLSPPSGTASPFPIPLGGRTVSSPTALVERFLRNFPLWFRSRELDSTAAPSPHLSQISSTRSSSISLSPTYPTPPPPFPVPPFPPAPYEYAHSSRSSSFSSAYDDPAGFPITLSSLARFEMECSPGYPTPPLPFPVPPLPLAPYEMMVGSGDEAEDVAAGLGERVWRM